MRQKLRLKIINIRRYGRGKVKIVYWSATVERYCVVLKAVDEEFLLVNGIPKHPSKTQETPLSLTLNVSALSGNL